MTRRPIAELPPAGSPGRPGPGREPLAPVLRQEIRRVLDEDAVLPGAAYRSPSVYEAELALFHDTWVGVACGQNVPQAGALFPVRIAGRTLFLARDEDDTIRVFYNLCRHRGTQLVDAPCVARGGLVTCPYHAWSFGLDGRLRGAPYFHREGDRHHPEPFEAKGLGLLPVRSALWRDVVFVNLSGSAPPFEEFIAPLDHRLAPWSADALQALGTEEYRIEANWKLAAENFLDAYHLPVVHPQLGGGFVGALATEDVEVSDDVLGLAMPVGLGPGSVQDDSPLPRFPGLAEDDDLRVEVFCVFPNTLILVEPDNQQVIVLRPQGPEQTEETLANYGVSAASEPEDLGDVRAELHREGLLVNEQDAALLARLQPARSMDVGGETRPCPAWDQTCLRFQRLWARRLLGVR